MSRYLPHVAVGVSVRLLSGAHKLSALLSAVDAFALQHQTKAQVRSSSDLHDRFVFVDGVACYQSGASFKDGARKAPTRITQITDAFLAMRGTYEQLWNGAVETTLGIYAHALPSMQQEAAERLAALLKTHQGRFGQFQRVSSLTASQSAPLR